MKTLSSAMTNHINGVNTSLVGCMKITRLDSTVFTYTDHDADIVVSSLTYKALPGFAESAKNAKADLSVDNLQIQGVIRDDAITDDDIKAGLFDHAAVEIFMVNWKDPSMGKIVLSGARLGETVIRDNRYAIDVRSKTQAYQQRIGDVYTPECRVDLYSSACGIVSTSTAYASNGAVTSVLSNQQFIDTTLTSFASGWFDYGRVVWLTGNNAGVDMEVKRFVSSTFTIELYHPMAKDIQKTDTYRIKAGCNHQHTKVADASYVGDCKDKFDNVINFRGFPTIPGTTGVTKIESV
jgi:uncharacterized phage protein (TIGR02218 family)